MTRSSPDCGREPESSRRGAESVVGGIGSGLSTIGGGIASGISSIASW